MKLLNLQSELLTSIQTASGDDPQDIAVTQDGDLVYIDSDTVSIVKNGQIQTTVTLQRWTPLNICSTSSGDLLVTMDNDDWTQSKVVRYSGSTAKQTIQLDDRLNPLYSSGTFLTDKSISENRNLDICVADRGANAVVVVDQSGTLRFRYTGSPSDNDETFDPVGITTDSQGHILIADFKTGCIHILDQGGQFLRYIENCQLVYPSDLCVDTSDNLFVVEWCSAKVKKIKYM
jgi:hypothetical protein